MSRIAACLCTLFVVLAASPAQDKSSADRMKGSANRMNSLQPGMEGETRIAREVRHELLMLPYYGVFDNLEYSVSGNVVTLSGQVTRPTLKSDAEKVVKSIEGVERVDNQLQVLPLSPMDDGIRLATYRAIYGQSGLDRYALQAVPPIHIIVDNGKVTLVGVTASKADKDMAGVRANTVSGVFAVTNDLQVAGK
jgi:hyperosmotically inducible periplasmic protein